MANYYATARSNYFRVNNAIAFQQWCAKRHLDCWMKPYIDNADKYAISPNANTDSGWPYFELDENGDDFEIDIYKELSEHLHPKDIAVLIQVGNEKLRYLTGEAVAVHASGRIDKLHLEEIYERAMENIEDGVQLTEVAY